MSKSSPEQARAQGKTVSISEALKRVDQLYEESGFMDSIRADFCNDPEKVKQLLQQSEIKNKAFKEKYPDLESDEEE